MQLFFHYVYTGFTVKIPVQVVPQRIESVNGSATNMGCTSPLVDSGDVMLCNSSDCSASYLLDGNSPAIDTSTSDWASQLVTVRKNGADIGRIPFDHVVLTFGFDTAVSLTSIELDLFLCPEWNIGAPLIAVNGDKNRDFVLTSQSVTFLGSSEPSQSSCDSLSTVSIPLQDDAASSSYLTWHITVRFTDNANIEWFIVGEVRFMGTSADHTTCSTPKPPSGMFLDNVLRLKLVWQMECIVMIYRPKQSGDVKEQFMYMIQATISHFLSIQIHWVLYFHAKFKWIHCTQRLGL